MGASPEIVASGSGYARDCAGRLRRNHHAVPEQRDLSRGGRCSDCNAAVVGVEHHQPRARSVPDFRARSVSADGRDGRGSWPRSRGARSACCTSSIGCCKGTERIHILVRHLRINVRVMAQAAAGFADGDSAVCHRECELDRAGADHLDFRIVGCGGLHDCHSHRGVLHSAVVGTEQRCGHAGGTEPGGEEAGPRGTGGMAHGLLQHDLPRSDRGFSLSCLRRRWCGCLCRIRRWFRSRQWPCAHLLAATSDMPTAW